MFIFPLVFDALRKVIVHAAPGMPADYWWVTALVFGILFLSALIDAFTTTVPDVLIFLGLVATTSTQGLYVSWETAAYHLRLAIGAGLLIWVINYLWYLNFHHDALGMGDAKWTMLAVACFGVIPVIYAWSLGAIFASLFIGVARLTDYRVTQVSFAPFLLVGLFIGLYVARFVG